MKSYLSLIPLSAKVRKRQNRMTILCIVIAVLLVTVVFSLSEMFLRMESDSMEARHGSWQLQLEDPTEAQLDSLQGRAGLLRTGVLKTFNFDGDAAGYLVENKKAVLYGAEESTLAQFSNSIPEGRFPQNDTEAMLTPNAADSIGAAVGDTVTVHTPAGDYAFTVCGIGTEDASYYAEQTYLVGVYLTKETFDTLMQANGTEAEISVCCLQFDTAVHAAEARNALEDEGCSVRENLAVMGLAGQSSNASMLDIYSLAAVLFVLVLLAGVLMISGSMNSSIAQRTRFFGMLRCTGASRAQVVRIVRMEALSWCKTAVPVGLVLGTGISWAVCAILHYGIGGEWATMPVGKLSPVGLICGAAVGLLTVLLAAQAPARRAAKVSPVAAVSGNADAAKTAFHAAKLQGRRAETALGIHHAVSARKNWCLMTASFALSILLFFVFSVLLDFATLLMPGMTAYQPDIALNGYANGAVLDRSLVDEIAALPGVTHVYGVSFAALDVTAADGTTYVADLCAYDEGMLNGAERDLAKGTMDGVAGDNGKALVLFTRENHFQVGDSVTIRGQTLTICGALSQGIGQDDQTIFCSRETYDRIMGVQPYTGIYVQVAKDVPDETLAVLRGYENADIIVQNIRQSNQANIASYWAVRIGAYCFLVVLALITLVNIVNSISMSVSARTKQYGVLRAIGMDSRQLACMIAAEGFTYAVSGLLVGCALGLVLHHSIYLRLVTHYFGQAWQFPLPEILLASVFALAAASIAVYAPAKRLCTMPVTEVLSEL